MSSFLHSPTWQKFQESAGFPSVLWNNQLFVEKKFGFGSYWVSSRCQIKSSWDLNKADFSRKACFWRLEPETKDDLDNLQLLAKQNKLALRSTAAVQPRQTILVNLKNSDEEIIQSMKPKHRYNLKVAQRSGLEAEVYHQNLTRQFPRLWRLLQETAARQSFRLHPLGYYQKMLEVLQEEQMVRLIFIKKQSKDLAGLILITYNGTATYLHGASIPSHKELMAPYLLHWQAIQTAKELGCRTYDLWGSNADFNQDKQEWQSKSGHPSAGTTRFKLGFGGEVVNYPGAYDLIFQPFCYNVYQGIRKLRSPKRAFA